MLSPAGGVTLTSIPPWSVCCLVCSILHRRFPLFGGRPARSAGIHTVAFWWPGRQDKIEAYLGRGQVCILQIHTSHPEADAWWECSSSWSIWQAIPGIREFCAHPAHNFLACPRDTNHSTPSGIRGVTFSRCLGWAGVRHSSISRDLQLLRRSLCPRKPRTPCSTSNNQISHRSTVVGEFQSNCDSLAQPQPYSRGRHTLVIVFIRNTQHQAPISIQPTPSLGSSLLPTCLNIWRHHATTPLLWCPGVGSRFSSKDIATRPRRELHSLKCPTQSIVCRSPSPPFPTSPDYPIHTTNHSGAADNVTSAHTENQVLSHQIRQTHITGHTEKYPTYHFWQPGMTLAKGTNKRKRKWNAIAHMRKKRCLGQHICYPISLKGKRTTHPNVGHAEPLERHVTWFR